MPLCGLNGRGAQEAAKAKLEELLSTIDSMPKDEVEAEEKIQLKLYEKQQADMAKLADYVEAKADLEEGLEGVRGQGVVEDGDGAALAGEVLGVRQVQRLVELGARFFRKCTIRVLRQF